MSYTKSDVKYYAVNVCDLSTLKPVERLLVQNKISSLQVVHINSEIGGSAVILQSTIKNDEKFNLLFTSF